MKTNIRLFYGVVTWNVEYLSFILFILFGLIKRITQLRLYVME